MTAIDNIGAASDNFLRGDADRDTLREEASDVDEDEAGVADTVEVEGVGVLGSQVTGS